MAVTVQYEKGGAVKEWLLDVVEITKRHTGWNLAVELAKVLDDFGIGDKVSKIYG